MEKLVVEGYINNIIGFFIVNFILGNLEDGFVVVVRKGNKVLLEFINDII